MSREPEVTVAGMLRRIEAGRADFDALLASNPPASADGWSVKDHMAHIACWERSGLALLNSEERMAHVGLKRHDHETLGLDGINDHIYAFYLDRPEPEIHALYRDTHAALIARLQSMTDADLLLPYSYYQPDDPPYDENPVWHWIAGNTFGHYEEHAAILRSS